MMILRGRHKDKRLGGQAGCQPEKLKMIQTDQPIKASNEET